VAFLKDVCAREKAAGKFKMTQLQRAGSTYCPHHLDTDDLRGRARGFWMCFHYETNVSVTPLSGVVLV
jgi:hypothetical protein